MERAAVREDGDRRNRSVVRLENEVWPRVLEIDLRRKRPLARCTRQGEPQRIPPCLRDFGDGSTSGLQPLQEDLSEPLFEVRLGIILGWGLGDPPGRPVGRLRVIREAQQSAEVTHGCRS